MRAVSESISFESFKPDIIIAPEEKRPNSLYIFFDFWATAKIRVSGKIMTTACNADYFIDITGEVCPMTFVKTKLQIERMSVGEILEIRLKGQEPLTNVPRSLKELGHEILSFLQEASDEANPAFRLRVRKS